MKLLFENWRKYLRESESGMREFVFSESELRELNRSISKIVSAAKSVLGADGPTPILNAKSLEKIKLDKSQKDPTPLKMVAEQDADVIDLRQRYYGPGGELEKSSPRAVRGLDKGLGQMSAQEFEDTGYVMKVPQEVLEDFNVLVESTKKTGDLYEQARDWYHNIRELLNQETNNDRDAALLGLLIAVYSPRAKFSLNLAEASFMYKAVQEDAANNPELLREYLETFPGAEKKEPGSPHGFTGAHKVPNFALNLIAPELAGQRDKDTGKIKYNDMYEWNSTIDTWMIDAFYPMLRKASTAKEWDAIKGKLMSNVVSYRYMARLVAQQARKFNLLPHELQAIIWVSMQVRQTGEAGLGVTTQFAFNQIKDAIVNIRTINNDLETARQELEEKSWLGTLFDEIDNKGFNEAAKFILGIKNEKGKITVPGVRSISASGKSGSAFQYYTPPEDSSQEKTTIKKQKKPKGKKVARPKPEKRYADPKYSELKTFYVMNEVIQMPTGKFNNLYDAITLYLDPEFSTEKAVEYITGRFDPEATASSKYFKEEKMLQELAAGYSPHNPGQLPLRPAIGTQVMPPAPASTLSKAGEKIPRDSADSEQVAKAVIHRNNHVLLLQNDKGYDLPGGHCKRGESIVKGLQREIFEETGLNCGAEVVKLHLHNPNKHFFAVELPSDDIHISDEHSGYQIVPFKKALKMPMSKLHKKAIRKAMEIIISADSLRSQDDAARLTLTPDGSRQDRAPHAPMRRQIKPLAERSQISKQDMSKLNSSELARFISGVKKRVVEKLIKRYCYRTSEEETKKCFKSSINKWMQNAGEEAMPLSLKAYTDYFNINRQQLKQKLLAPGEAGSSIEKMAIEFAKEVAPKIEKGLATPVYIVPPDWLASTVEGGGSPAGHWKESGKIGVRSDVREYFKNRYNTYKGFRIYIEYVLKHEFQHGIDRVTGASSKQSFLNRRTAIGGDDCPGYYKNKSEFYAELLNVLSTLRRLPNKEDVDIICGLYKIYGKNNMKKRIALKAKQGMEITEYDIMLNSPVLMCLVDCDNPEKTLKRFRTQAYKAKQMEERRKRK